MKTLSDNLIKILSLGIGLAIGIVLIAQVCFELSYDGFKDVDSVYCITENLIMQQGDDPADYWGTSGAVAPSFKAEVPGVEAATRYHRWGGNNYFDETDNLITGQRLAVDTCFFEFFDRPVLAGDPMHVFEDFPANTTVQCDKVTSIGVLGDWSINNWLGNDGFRGFVRLAPNVDPDGLKDAIGKMQETHQDLEAIEKEGSSISYTLTPFATQHGNEKSVRNVVLILSVVAVLLLLVSLMNYLLMAISDVVRRSKEMFAMRIGLSPTYFIIGAVAVLLVVTVVVVLSSNRVARMNSVKSMKNN